ncbi:predicted protein [Cyanophage PSS2]|nr:predicted protein [Cyanophage PSS2]
MINTADELLTELMADSTFMGLVGDYHFKGGTTADAIAVLADMQEVEGVEDVSGLEVIIPKTPMTTSQAFLTGTEGAIAKAWKIFLIQYDSANNNTLTAADHLLCRVPGADYSVIGNPDIAAMAGVEQVVVNLPPYSSFIDGVVAAGAHVSGGTISIDGGGSCD